MGLGGEQGNTVGIWKTIIGMLGAGVAVIVATTLTVANLNVSSTIKLTEISAPSVGTTGQAVIYADTGHTLKVSLNGGAYGDIGSGSVGITGVTGVTGITGPTGAGTTATYSKAFILTNPSVAGNSPLWRAPAALTITHIHVLCIGGTNIVGQLEQYDANGGSAASVDNSDITGTAGTNVDDDGTLSNPSVVSGGYVGWKTTSVSGVPTRAIITFEYTIP